MYVIFICFGHEWWNWASVCPIFLSCFDFKILSNFLSNFYEICHPVPGVGALFWWDLHTLWPSNDTAVLYCSCWLQGQNSVQKEDDIQAEHTHNLMEATCHAWNVQFIVSNVDEISSLCPIVTSNFWWDKHPKVQFFCPIFDEMTKNQNWTKKLNITV